MNVLRSTSSRYVQNTKENMILTSYLDIKAVPYRKLRLICRKHPNDVVRQVKAIISVLRHNFHVALEVKLYYDWKTNRRCNRCILSLTTRKVLQYAGPFLAAFVRYIISTYSINTYVLLHFERKNWCHNYYQTSHSPRSSIQEFDTKM